MPQDQTRYPFPENLDELLESSVDRRADVWNVLPKVNGSDGALGDTFWGELELLKWGLAQFIDSISMWRIKHTL